MPAEQSEHRDDEPSSDGRTAEPQTVQDLGGVYDADALAAWVSMLSDEDLQALLNQAQSTYPTNASRESATRHASSRESVGNTARADTLPPSDALSHPSRSSAHQDEPPPLNVSSSPGYRDLQELGHRHDHRALLSWVSTRTDEELQALLALREENAHVSPLKGGTDHWRGLLMVTGCSATSWRAIGGGQPRSRRQQPQPELPGTKGIAFELQHGQNLVPAPTARRL